MKKLTLIAILLLILGLAFSSEKTKETPVEKFETEEEIQLEDWMTEPFIIENKNDTSCIDLEK